MRKSILISIALVSGVLLGFLLRDLLPKKPAAAKLITIKSRSLNFAVASSAETVGEALAEQNFLKAENAAIPSAESRLINGMTIEVRTPIAVEIDDGGRTEKVETLAATVQELIAERHIPLAPTDRVAPDIFSFLGDGMKIAIDRIVDVEVTEESEVPNAVKQEYDPESFYGREQVLLPGKPGKRERKFLITYKNGVEVKRRLLVQKVLENPQTEVRSFGTKIEVEEQTLGRASWYAYQNCMCAAHPFYSKGRYVRVISAISGKSVIVQINDRGPDLSVHPDRVIDLDATAFKQLAPLGSGTIEVGVELLR